MKRPTFIAMPKVPRPLLWGSDVFHWNNFKSLVVDFNRFIGSLARNASKTMKEALCRAWPANSSCTAIAEIQKAAGNSNEFTSDQCKYCFNRPRARSEAELKNEDTGYKHGTGDGAHNPRTCPALKRYIAEGCELDPNSAEGIKCRECLVSRDKMNVEWWKEK